MITDIRWFNNYDFEKNLKDWVAYTKTIPNEVKHQVFAIYFDELDDTYRVFIASISGDRITNDLYSWDELSQFLHDNI